jgi:hypothetical protein
VKQGQKAKFPPKERGFGVEVRGGAGRGAGRPRRLGKQGRARLPLGQETPRGERERDEDRRRRQP